MKTNILSLGSARNVTLFALLTLFAAASVFAEGDVETRSSATSQGKTIQRGALTDGAITFSEHDALVVEGSRAKPQRENAQQKLTSGAARAVNTDFWIYDATVDLFSDLDGDGYFYGIDLWFDADTVYSAADVYAVVYLSLDLGPWNEYAETDVFSIFGASGDDAYAIETELVSGYPTGDYDILVELYDTFDNALVASFGPEDTSEFSLLPLEDVTRDTPPDTTIVVNSGSGGGALGWLAMFALIALAGRRLLRPAA